MTSDPGDTGVSARHVLNCGPLHLACGRVVFVAVSENLMISSSLEEFALVFAQAPVQLKKMDCPCGRGWPSVERSNKQTSLTSFNKIIKQHSTFPFASSSSSPMTKILTLMILSSLFGQQPSTSPWVFCLPLRLNALHEASLLTPACVLPHPHP